MSTRAHGPTAGFHWLRRAINVGRHNSRALFAGAAVLMAVWLMPTVLQLVLMAAFKPGEDVTIAIGALMTLLWLATLVPLMGGYLRMIDAGEHGQPAHARDIFQLFRSGAAWGACVRFALLMLLVHLLVGYVLVTLFGQGVMEWYLDAAEKIQQAQQAGVAAGGTPPQLPDAPSGTAGLVGLGSLWLLLFGCAFAIGLGQVAIGGRGVREATVDGFAGTARNLAPLLVMAVLGVGAMAVVAVGMFLVLLVVGGVAGLLHPTLGLAAILPLYVAFLTVLYAVVLSVMYQIWRDVAGPAPVAGPSPPDQLEPHHLEA
ncbi:hypothetical protein [Agrilutibacter solisilvae]|uniref:DUF2189 domain-containing protein n=1 Tax=Agrilutibacter solisilvae TaxID=2763317 RepID=A0A974Y278_9GAMM|nr:hypothetical protein [Lysobacter solisilvae]QSX79235.1 hypothetical protein I8J32_004945 [Lysobacter solisilvae]